MEVCSLRDYRGNIQRVRNRPARPRIQGLGQAIGIWRVFKIRIVVFQLDFGARFGSERLQKRRPPH
jgi:hypothetical protein